jgi:D-erythronate 2-dehydrogenase
LVCDLSMPRVAEDLVANRPDIIFHMAAIVSGEAEADFEKGYRVNVSATKHIFEALRHARYQAGLVFTSAIAIFGAPFPEMIGDEATGSLIRRAERYRWTRQENGS